MSEETIVIRYAAQAPRLSVLTPFLRHDPSAMLARFMNAPAGVEFVLYDDGSNDNALLDNVVAAAERLGAPVRIITNSANVGRAKARNRLIEAARGDHVLFLDADMLPETSAFLAIWLGVIETQAPIVAFGGLSLRGAQRTESNALHYALFGGSDCQPARARARRPAQSVASANLLVQRAFLLEHPFDDSFSGWGFEDVDWAISASRAAEIMHVDNPAGHIGLDDLDTLMRKSGEAGPNFARLARKHPAHVSRFAAHRIARALRAIPARHTQRRFYAWVARGGAPMRLRCTAFKLLRASHYAEHLP